MAEKTDNRGGARAGAGRPKLPDSEKVKYERHTIVFKPEDWSEINRIAKECGKTVSRYMVDKSLDR